MRGDYTITEHDPARDSDEEIAERVQLGNELNAEVLPDDPPTRVETAIAAERARPARLCRRAWRVRDADGTLVGSAGFNYDPEHDDNPDLAYASLAVLGGHRRHGLGTALLERLSNGARDNGRKRLWVTSNSVIPAGAAFAQTVGARPGLVETINVLPIDEVDPDQMQTWVEDGPRRAADYELIPFDGPAPADLVDDYVKLILVMNTAPHDDLERNDFTLTVDQLRESEAIAAAAGRERWTLLARHRETGELAGYHNITWQPADDPHVVWVDSTAVEPTHRGHALGKWLKATMTRRIIDELPAVTQIRTGNADSNDAMLGINHAMGYRALVSFTTWELTL